MRVRHFGNTANNAYHNVLLLEKYVQVESELPIRMYGLQHAISAPAWEAVDFDVPNAAWVSQPDWSEFPEAVAINSRYSDIVPPRPASAEPIAEAPPGGIGALVTAARTRVFGPLRGKRWAQPLISLRDRQSLTARPAIDEIDGSINLMYGSGSLFSSQLPRPARSTVCLEHGTIRWIADGHAEEKAFRDAYRAQVQGAAHLWVTNLDPRTLEVAEDVAPGRWSAFPHPFIPDDRVPFAEVPEERADLLRQTSSEALILLPASQNWSKDHDKGSMTALLAFVELRRKGLDVGLVAIEWGHQVAESKQFLERSGVAGNVMWMPPMARFPLQRLMANVDVVWDQFGVEAFGALALRIVEQGTPLISRGLAPASECFVGGPAPWTAAATTDEIVYETSRVLEAMATSGRAVVVEATRARYRTWLFARHSPKLTAALQRDRYAEILNGTFDPRTVAKDEWARRADVAAGEAGK